VLPEIATHGVLQYARQLFIEFGQGFDPTIFQPYIRHFQCFDRIQELGIFRLDTRGFLESFDTYFMNFIPTLLSLHLGNPGFHLQVPTPRKPLSHDVGVHGSL